MNYENIDEFYGTDFTLSNKGFKNANKFAKKKGGKKGNKTEVNKNKQKIYSKKHVRAVTSKLTKLKMT